MAQPDQCTLDNSILVTSAVKAAVMPQDDLKDYQQNIVGRNTEVTVKDTDNDKETVVRFDSENGTFYN